MDYKGLTGRPLADAVIDHVLTFPERHDQATVLAFEETSSPCGSVGCIAGWAIALNAGVQFYDQLSYEAQDRPDTTAAALLGVDPDRFWTEVYNCPTEHEAIANLKNLMDEV